MGPDLQTDDARSDHALFIITQGSAHYLDIYDHPEKTPPRTRPLKNGFWNLIPAIYISKGGKKADL
jgi:hypothetical protein